MKGGPKQGCSELRRVVPVVRDERRRMGCSQSQSCGDGVNVEIERCKEIANAR